MSLQVRQLAAATGNTLSRRQDSATHGHFTTQICIFVIPNVNTCNIVCIRVCIRAQNREQIASSIDSVRDCVFYFSMQDDSVFVGEPAVLVPVLLERLLERREE